MATNYTKQLSRAMISPAVFMLFMWMIVPLSFTIYFSFLRYNLLKPDKIGFTGVDNYYYFLTDPVFFTAMGNTLSIIGGVLALSVFLGIFLALLLNTNFYGQGIVRILVISPFFIMPTVSGLVWKNMFLNPVNGLFAWGMRFVGMEPYDFLNEAPLLSVTLIVAWQWVPFATLILLTSLQSLDSDQLEASEMDGAGKFSQFFHIVVPHLSRAITAVLLIETIFLLSIFAEILVTTNGGPGHESTNLTYMIFVQALQTFDIGGASAGGIVAVVFANIVAIFLLRFIGKNLEA